jgi:hypothetical protein
MLLELSKDTTSETSFIKPFISDSRLSNISTWIELEIEDLRHLGFTINYFRLLANNTLSDGKYIPLTDYRSIDNDA